MDASNKTSAVVHLARIVTLSVAVVGLAWIVLTTQRRATRSLSEPEGRTDEPALPDLAEFDAELEFPDLAPIETTLRLPEVPYLVAELPAVEPARIEFPLDYALPEWPAPQFEFEIALPRVMEDAFRVEIDDRYIGSSKSAVIMPVQSRSTRQNQRHGKP